jgi:predicted nuclease of predicted toxin-antitoxin system
MRIKLDENIPATLADDLARLEHDVDTAGREGLRGAADPVIWSAAQAAKRFLVTQDLDFSDLRRFKPGTHAGILLVRLVRPARRRVIERIRTLFETENAGQWSGCFVIATESKVRVRRPE